MADYNLGTASGRIVVDGSPAELGFKVARTAAESFFDVVKSKVDDVQTLGKRMAGVGAAGVGGFGLAIKAASGFEQQMSGVKAVAGATEEQFQSLRDKALQLGKDTAFSASEAGLAIEELVKAGVGVEDVLNGAADATTALAAAGGVSLPEAATIAANAMNAFGMSAKEVPKVANILAGVANKGAADVSSLGSSLSQVSAVANLAGLSLKDTAIALGELSDAGINGSDAGTSLKTMLNNLIPATKDQLTKFQDLGLITYDLANANKVLAKEGLPLQKSMSGVQEVLGKWAEEMGKGEKGSWRAQKAINALLQDAGAMNNEFFDAKGNVKGLAGVQDALASAVEGQTRQQKLQNLEILFGADSMRAAAVMAKEGAKGVHDYNKALDETDAADVAATRLDNLAGSMEQMKGSFETAMITIGNIFLPVITKIIDGITWVVNIFNNMPKALQIAIAVLIGVASSGMLVVGMLLAAIPAIAGFVVHMLMMRAIGTVTSGFKVFFSTLRGGQGVLMATKLGMLQTGTAAKTLSLRTLFAGKMMFRFGKMARAAWLLATGPVGIAVAAIAALVAVGVLLYKKWQPFHDLVDRVAAVLKEKLAVAIAYLTPYLNKAKKWFAQLGEVIRGKLLQAWNSIKAAIPVVLGVLKRVGEYIATTLMPTLKQVGAFLLGKLKKGWDSIKDSLSTLIAPIKDLIGNLRGAGDAGGGFISKLAPYFQKFGAILRDQVFPFLVKVGKAFTKYVLPILIKVAGFLTGVLIDAIVGVVTGAIQFVKGIINIFSGLIKFWTGVFTGNWSKAWEGIKQVFHGAFDAIIGALRVYLNIGMLKIAALGFALLKGLVKGSWRLILGLFKGAGKGLWSIVKGAFNLVIKLVKNFFGMHVKIASKGWGLIRKIFTTVLDVLKALVKGAWEFIKGNIARGMQIIRDGISKAWNYVKDGTVRAWNAIKDSISTRIRNIIDTVRSIPGKIMDALGNMKDFLFNTGGDIVQGLINGIQNMGKVLWDAVKALVVENIPGPVRKILDIGSPSKLMEQYGNWTGEGLQIGLEDTRKDVARSALKVAREAIVGFQATLDPKAMRAMAHATAPPLPVAATSGRAGATYIDQRKYDIDIPVHNPVPERAGQSVSKVLRDKVQQGGWSR